MKQKAVLFGREKSLIGIIASPGTTFPGDRPAVVLLNSGTLHRVGPNRIYVQFAQRLADDGFLSFRFDLSGVGDSRPRQSTDNDSGQNVIWEDIRDALDFLQKTREISKFILIGLCSGANHSFSYACKDERVVGVHLIEGFSFPAASYYVESYGRSLFSLQSWKRILTGKSEVWRILRGLLAYHTSKQARQLFESWEVPGKELLLSGLKMLQERSVKIGFTYCESSSGFHNFKNLLSAEVDRMDALNKPLLQVRDNTDHLFTLLSEQNWLINELMEWAQEFVDNKRPMTSESGGDA